jgi:hydrogenase maturation protease
MTLAEVVDTPLLIYGLGNVGRQDDGLGPLLVEQLEAAGVPDGVTLETGYQLAPEDALVLSAHETVLFVDASAATDAPAPYGVQPVSPSTEISFSTHAMSMGSLLALCARLYGRAPRAYALAIPGHAFEVNAELSTNAAANLAHATRDLRHALARHSPRA